MPNGPDRPSASRRPPARLRVLKATRADLACVIRRGPTRWFHVALWRYGEGVVEPGAWTRRKLYPERCALAPDGGRLGVFALGGEWGAYFAVSRPPWLHALAAWRTLGTWTTGASFGDGGELTIAGCADPEPFHGTYPGPVACEAVDTHWVRARLFRELRTGWDLEILKRRGRTEEAGAGRMPDLPVSLEPYPDAVVISRLSPDASAHLVLVSLWPGQREYYLVRAGRVRPLDGVVWADWSASGRLLAATDRARLRVLDADLDLAWEHDMDASDPDPRPAPEWARAWSR